MSPMRAIKSNELILPLLRGGFILTKFVSNVPSSADKIDNSTLSTESKVFASCQVDASHVLGLK